MQSVTFGGRDGRLSLNVIVEKKAIGQAIPQFFNEKRSFRRFVRETSRPNRHPRQAPSVRARSDPVSAMFMGSRRNHWHRPLRGDSYERRGLPRVRGWLISMKGARDAPMWPKKLSEVGSSCCAHVIDNDDNRRAAR